MRKTKYQMLKNPYYPITQDQFHMDENVNNQSESQNNETISQSNTSDFKLIPAENKPKFVLKKSDTNDAKAERLRKLFQEYSNKGTLDVASYLDTLSGLNAKPNAYANTNDRESPDRRSPSPEPEREKSPVHQQLIEWRQQFMGRMKKKNDAEKNQRLKERHKLLFKGKKKRGRRDDRDNRKKHVE
eukprot:UN27333